MLHNSKFWRYLGFILLHPASYYGGPGKSFSTVNVRFMVNQRYNGSGSLRVIHTLPAKPKYGTRLLQPLRCAVYLANTVSHSKSSVGTTSLPILSIIYLKISDKFSVITQQFNSTLTHSVREVSSLKNEFEPMVLSLRIFSLIFPKTMADAKALLTDPPASRVVSSLQ